MHERLKLARDMAGLTQLQMAEGMEMSRSAITQFESPNPATRKAIRVEYVKRWAGICGIEDYNHIFSDDYRLEELQLMWQAGRTRRSQPDPDECLADRLRTARTFAGKTQLDVAEALGVSRSAVAQFESANPDTRKPVSAEYINAWAACCGVPAADLTEPNVGLNELSLRWARDRAGNPPSQAPASADGLPAVYASHEQIDAWRNAVKFDCMSRDPRRSAAFDVKLGVHGVELTAPYLSGRTLVGFAGFDPNMPRLYSTAVSRVLLLEAAANRGNLHKHLILLAGPAQGAGGEAVDFQVPVFGVHLHVVNSVQAASEIVMSLK
jgi:transcriptional regulator with XRE-family HTH domain